MEWWTKHKNSTMIKHCLLSCFPPQRLYISSAAATIHPSSLFTTESRAAGTCTQVSL